MSFDKSTHTGSYVVVGFAVGGAAWYIGRLASRPDGACITAVLSFPSHLQSVVVIWTKNNPTPWNNVNQNENIKLMTGNHKFEKR
jgi:NADH dehydrogenase (ubiquinone) 1 alpha subcomplex subunit 4